MASVSKFQASCQNSSVARSPGLYGCRPSPALPMKRPSFLRPLPLEVGQQLANEPHGGGLLLVEVVGVVEFLFAVDPKPAHDRKLPMQVAILVGVQLDLQAGGPLDDFRVAAAVDAKSSHHAAPLPFRRNA